MLIMLVNHISAFARNMQVVSGITIIGQYFMKKRATANSLMSNCIGGVVMAPLIQVSKISLNHYCSNINCQMGEETKVSPYTGSRPKFNSIFIQWKMDKFLCL